MLHFSVATVGEMLYRSQYQFSEHFVTELNDSFSSSPYKAATELIFCRFSVGTIGSFQSLVPCPHPPGTLLASHLVPDYCNRHISPIVIKKNQVVASKRAKSVEK